MTRIGRARTTHERWLLIMAAALLCIAPAWAEKPIVVSSADPDMGEQGTYDLEVTVGGDSFPSDAAVDFFVTGTTDPGGITVKSVKRQGPKVLKVRIDIDEAAQTQYKFDIQVRSQSNGRSGKGTELFGVSQKGNGSQDRTPPGEPTDFRVLNEGYGTVDVAWTMPADDGYDAASGPVESCGVKVDEAWGMCYSHSIPPWPAPGEEAVCSIGLLDPSADYVLGVLCVDEAQNWSPEAQVVASTRPFSEFRDPSWAVEEVPYPLSYLSGHRLDGEGNLVIGGVVYLWEEQGKGNSVAPAVIRIIKGDQSSGDWAWSYEDVPGFYASYRERLRLRIDPVGRPAFVGRYCDGPRKCRLQLIYTFHDGSGWVSEVVSTDSGSEGFVGFAFDASGQPGVAWCSGGNPGGVRLGRRVAPDQWNVQVINETDCDIYLKGVGELAFDGAGNPAISYDAADETRVALWTGSDWVDELVQSPGFTSGSSSHLTLDPVRGDFTTAGDAMIVCERLGTNSWQCSRVPFGYGVYNYNGGAFSGFDSTGEFFMGYVTFAEQDVGAVRRPPGGSWTGELVDYFAEHGLPSRPHQEGPFLSFDSRDLPTLTWDWRFGPWKQPSEYHLYFAWKTTP